jgi:predicted transcriptional regulator
MSRGRLNVFLEREHARRLEELAAVKGLSKSAIVAAALSAFLSTEGAGMREAAIARRLDKLRTQGERFGRDQTILIETLALFIRVYLTVSTPIPEGHQEAARAQGKARFEQFITQLGRDLQRGSSFAKTLERDIVSPTSPFVKPDEATPVRDPAP